MSVGEAVSRFPRERTWLLPALQSAQRAEGWLSPETLAAVAAHLRVPQSEVWGVASHYPELRLAKPGRRVVRVCTGVACVVRGGERLLARCEGRLGIRAGETTRDGALTLEAMDCAFACAVAPVVEADHAYRGRVSEAALDALLDTPAVHVVPAPLTGRGGPPATPATAGSPGARFTVLRREAERRRTGSRLAVGVGTCGLAVGAGETLEALRVEVQRRGLAWTVVAAGCNGMCWAAPVVDALRDGTYGTLARVLEEARPEAVIEELRAAGLAGRGGAYFQTAVKWSACRAAAGAPKYLVVNGEEGEPGIFKDRHLMEGDPHRLLEAALIAAYATGASRAILYIHGEADVAAERLAVALGQARQWGLIGERVLGSDLSLGVEIRRGAGGFVLGEETALLESIEGQRAMPRTRPPFPVESGLFGKPTVINNVETLIPRGAVNPGTGGVVALGEAAAVRGAVRTLLAFNTRESCGKCTPCREGTARMLAMLDETSLDVARVRALAETVQLASLCGLGQAAPLAVLSGLAEFPREFGVS